MKLEKRTFVQNSNALAVLFLCVSAFLLSVLTSSTNCLAVTSKVIRHNTIEHFSTGQTDNIIIDSKGTIKLGRSAETLVEDFKDLSDSPNGQTGDYQPWSINSIVLTRGTFYIGTSPNGGIYKYSMGKLAKIYPTNSDKSKKQPPGTGSENNNELKDANLVEEKQHLTNEHIFAMATDLSGRLLAGISGEKCKLYRFEKNKPVVIFEPEDAKYIFAIAVADSGDIYLGTGPEGKIYQLDSFGQNPRLVYDSRDKNVLSLAVGTDAFLYAGTDTRGLVYKFNTQTNTPKVLYDSKQEEITSLVFSSQNNEPILYAAGTSAKIAGMETKFASGRPSPGRPEVPENAKNKTQKEGGGISLQIANTKKNDTRKPQPPGGGAVSPPKPSSASFIYQIDEDGFVTDVFTEPAVIFAVAQQQEKLLIGTGNNGRLFVLEPATERKAVIYKDKQASQITAVTVVGEDVYIGTANPAKFIKLAGNFAAEGTFTSGLLDGGQPAKWGKFQIEADIPEKCKVLMSSRSGNVEDVNDPTFSDWTEPVGITGPVQIQCPLGRFCQYKLTLLSGDGKSSPVIREVAVSNTVPNLKPVVESVDVERTKTSEKKGFFKISYKAEDDNDDKLLYKIDFRKLGRTNWIELEDETEETTFEWDSKTVEDGRYEIRVTAGDERSNTPAGALSDSRISEPFVVDNTGPVIEQYQKTASRTKLTLKLKISDELSAVDKVEYTVDSSADWITAIPNDLVYDTKEENIEIIIEELTAGEHVIAVKTLDAVGNATYKSFEININGAN